MAGRCLKCSHYDICNTDQIGYEELYGQCSYFEDDKIVMIPKSEYDEMKQMLEQEVQAKEEEISKLLSLIDNLRDDLYEVTHRDQIQYYYSGGN